MGSSPRDRRDRFPAAALTAPAHVGADPAMLHMLAMLRAFVAAQPAGEGARLQRGGEHALVRSGAARRELAGRETEVGAVEVQSDALAQLGDLLLGEARVGAGRAGLGAGEAIFDAAGQRGIADAFHLRMRGDHLSGEHRPVSSLSVAAFRTAGAAPAPTMAAAAWGSRVSPRT